VPPNGTQLQTLGRKFAFFNSYYPEQAIGLYPTDGTTDDFAYGDLGIAGYVFELGTAFFQGCSTFENTILPDNMPALIYAAKTSRTPYMTPAGPDALDVTATPNLVGVGDLVTLGATINDMRYRNVNGTEPTQNIVAAAYYIDTPPWITGTITNTMTAVDGNFNSSVEDVTATIDTTGLSNGRHTIFVRGQDANGNWGAVSADFLYVIDPATAPTFQGYVREAVTNTPLDATVSASGLFQTNTNPTTGFYQMHVISGTYDLKASAEGHGSQIISNVTISDNQTIDQDFSLFPVCTIFSDDVESGNIGWTADSPWAITTEASHSPTHSWTDSPGGNYDNNLNVSLTSPIIDLTDFSDIQLDYWQICDTEATWDFCHVEVSDDDGATWTEVGTYDGPHTQWENIVLSAPVLDNQPDAHIRFRLTTDINTTRDGWHVDDIQILGAGESCVVYTPPTAAFSSSSPDPLGTSTVFTNLSYGSDLNFIWDFGDTSLTVTDTNPSHTYPTTGFYTVTLTVTNQLGADVYSDVVEIFDYSDAEFNIDKTTSAAVVSPGDIFTYTLGAELVLTDTNTYSLMLTDTLPAEVSVLTDSIRIDGVPAPDLYISETHTINYLASGTFTDTYEVGITFQVQVESGVTSGTLITNQLDGQASTNGDLIPLPETEMVTTLVVTSSKNYLLLPIIMK
jgi:uncharacterized repeat protein (TIGR01451 family)